MPRVALADHYGDGRFGLSYELFPPKTEDGAAHLLEHVAQLMAFEPDFVTCTYGAGGSTRGKTLDTLDLVRSRWPLPVASHFTCVGAGKEQLRAYLAEARRRQVDYIVAIRGDPPRGDTGFQPVAGGLAHADELVAFIRAEFPGFGIAVAGYPETHQEAASPEADIAHLRRKVEAGADVVITQLFLRNSDFYCFVDRCRRAGIGVPIVPGILPVTNLAQVRRVAAMCGASFPAELLKRLEVHADDPVSQFAEGVYYSMCQVEDLVAHGVPGLHFYVLNRSHATALICRALRLPGHQPA